MASNDDLDARVTALEQQVKGIREDAAAARILARGADRDVSTMQQTLREHTVKLDEHTVILESHSAKLDEHTVILESHSAKLDEHTVILGSHGAKLDMHKVLLDSLRETQVEQGAELREIRRVLSSVAVGQAEILALLSRPDDPEPAG